MGSSGAKGQNKGARQTGVNKQCSLSSVRFQERQGLVVKKSVKTGGFGPIFPGKLRIKSVNKTNVFIIGY
jgi:hypothetical protein